MLGALMVAAYVLILTLKCVAGGPPFQRRSSFILKLAAAPFFTFEFHFSLALMLGA